MKALFIGGTGRISTAVSKLALNDGWDLYLLNRGNRNTPKNAKQIIADIEDEKLVSQKISSMHFDVVVDFIAFEKKQVERDYNLFKNLTDQYIFISSASAYHKPLANYIVNEGTSLANPFWKYSRAKIECEDFLMNKYRNDNFPITIVRPSHTYDENSVPVGLHGKNGSFEVIKRIIENKKIIIHGDGNSLWTMTHNSDFAKGFIGLMGNSKAIGEAVQITSDECLTWNQIYNCIAKALGTKLNPYYVSSSFLSKASIGIYDFEGALLGDKSNNIIFDNSKLKKLVPTFQATKSFQNGVYETVQNVLSHKELQVEDKEFSLWCDAVIDAQEKALEEVKTFSRTK